MPQASFIGPARLNRNGFQTIPKINIDIRYNDPIEMEPPLQLYHEEINEYKNCDTLYKDPIDEVSPIFIDSLYIDLEKAEISEIIRDMKDHIWKSFAVPKDLNNVAITPVRQAGKSLASTINNIFKKFMGGNNLFDTIETYIPSDEEVFKNTDDSTCDELYHE